MGAAPGCRQRELCIRHWGAAVGAGACVALGGGAASRCAWSPLSPPRWQPRGVWWVPHWGAQLRGCWNLLLRLVPVSAGEEEVVRSPGAFLTLTTFFLLLLVVQKQWGAASGGCRGTRAGTVGPFDSKPSLLILHF